MKIKKIIVRTLMVLLVALFLTGGGMYYVGWNLDEQHSVHDREHFQKRMKISTVIAKGLYLGVTKQRCAKPIKYSLGNMDDRFDITEDALKKVLQKAEVIWESDGRGNLFEYNPDAKFKINLVYDERQKMNDDKRVVNLKLKNIENEHQKIEEEYKKLAAEYDKKNKIHSRAVNKLSDDQYRHNLEVTEYNYGLGIDILKRKQLNARVDVINARIKRLIADENYLNNLSVKINKLVEQEKKLADNYAVAVEKFELEYKDKEGKTFDWGEYKRDMEKSEINIYAFVDESDLLLTLEHEFGHALGIDHVENPQSVMYYLMEKQDLENLKLTEEDLSGLYGACDLKKKRFKK